MLSPELQHTTEPFIARERAKKRADAYGKIMVAVSALCGLSPYILLFLVYPAVGKPLHELLMPRMSRELLMFLILGNWIYSLIVFGLSFMSTWILNKESKRFSANSRVNDSFAHALSWFFIQMDD